MSQDYEKWLSQFRKGFIELCVLTALHKKTSSYGFELLQVFEQAKLPLNEGTLYPLLNRMQKNGLLESHWESPTDGGHPRRFYQLGDKGKAILPLMLTAFENNTQSLTYLQELS